MGGLTGMAAIMQRGDHAAADKAPTDRPLTDQQRDLVEHLATGLSIEDAGTLAGYGTRQSAHRAAHLPHVMAALRERLQRDVLMAAPIALKTLTTSAGAARSERVRVDAATAILDRAGIGQASGAGASGPAVVLNLHVSGDIATMLTQRPVIEHATQAQQGFGEGDHHPTEVEGGQGEGEGQPATPPRAPRRPAAKAKGRGRKPAAKPGARAPRTISPKSKSVSDGEAP